MRSYLNEEKCIEFENALSEAMLFEAARNPDIKEVLQEIANQFNKLVFMPLKKAVWKADTFEELNKNRKDVADAIIKLAKHQSNERRQYGALLRDKFESHVDVIANIKNIRYLLSTIQETLININKLTTVDEIVAVLKLFVDLGIAYIESLHYPEKSTFKYKILEKEIFSSPRELAARIYRKELGEPELLAVNLGISRRKNDFIKKSDRIFSKTVTESGKAIFWGVSTEARMKCITANYASVFQKWLKTRNALHFKELNQIRQDTITEFGIKTANIICPKKLVNTLSIDFTALAYNNAPQLEKLAIAAGLPLIASTSGSLARPIIALIMQNYFRTNGKIDFDKLQILSNCMAGFLTHAGHHSISEAAETFNKTVLYFLIHERKYLPDDIFAKVRKVIGWAGTKNHMINIAKSSGYFYIFGNYESFFNVHYRKSLFNSLEIKKASIAMQKN